MLQADLKFTSKAVEVLPQTVLVWYSEFRSQAAKLKHCVVRGGEEKFSVSQRPCCVESQQTKRS